MEAEDDVCVVCSDDMTILAIGVCDHPICYKCSTRLRVLCEENYCPTCRTDLPQVVLVRKLQKFDDIKNKNEMPANPRYKMIFEDVDIENEFKKLISHHCPVCPAAGPEGFPKFSKLRTHLRIDHYLYYCELCSKNLKIFTSERKVYSQFELGRHRNEGDPDDTSYRGHPMCQFCQHRYMDTDELYRHLRKDHLFCHFCDADGHADQYYDNYNVLKEHFKRKHFLCEEPDCAQEQFTHAFRTDIDLKKHIAQEHSQSLTKAQARQARTIEVEFQLAPRVRPRDVSGGQMHYRNENRGRMSKNQRGRLYFEERDNEMKRAIQASLEDENQRERERQNMETEGARGGREEKENKKEKVKKEALPTPKLNLTDDFPSLTPRASEANTFQTQWTSRSNTSILVTNRNEEFPTLSALSIQPPPPPVPKVSSSGTKKQGTKKSEVNSHKQNQPSICFEKDFPELAAPKKRPNSANVSITVSNAWSNNKQSNHPQQQPKQPLKVQSQKKQPQQQQAKPQNQQPLITNSKALSKVSLSYTPPPESPAMPPPTVTLIESKPVETPVRSLKDVSKLLDTEENFPSLKKSKNKQQPSAKVSNWPVKKVTHKAPEESKKSTPEGCIVLKGKKHKEKTGDSNKQNKKDASCLDSNKLSSSTEYSANEPALNSQLQQSEKSNKKKEFSEVKIDLKKQPKNSDADKKQEQLSAKIVLSENEFPSLGKQEKPSVPTGIKANQVKPPPGFSGPFTNHNVKNHRPPPGLTLPNNNMKNLLTQNLASGSVTEMQQVTKFHYCPPSNFDKRNKNLISDINEALANDGSRFGTFKSLSRDFRQGTISSREYYRQCSDLLGSERFPQIFIELICLLPDIDKQQALLLAHRDSSALQINNFSKGAWRLFEKNLQSCPICQQALIKADYNAHLSLCHPNDFPLESTDSWSSGKFQESTWIKAK